MSLDTVGDNELLYAARGTVHWQDVNTALKSDDRCIDRAEECAKV